MPYDPDRHGPHRVVGPGFHQRVWEQVRRVPAGKVTTYGDVAAALGLRRAARQVGYALAALPPDQERVPWHRVVQASGRIARSIDSECGAEQARRLRAEGVTVDPRGRVVEFELRRASWS
ncbi:MAG: methylated-DNA--[protein]-cysteine S-methyltransferase [Planctomycetes bacterium]|nr:methylated-DNA--[protein]-cysteine S-methyltransferase [Planctomycetota bacterium]MCB9871383.1 methylated-DNA--[protein]-cysteine S-methyltransferase [Planctomycetota bacterium]MCB9888637.1 methylated-DNA--[protein]-cysteine S-methyltransferase [Planctomycetota bacterium]